MGIGSWFKKWRKREDDAEIQRAQNEFFDTPQEQQIESGDMEALQADYRAGMIARDPRVTEHTGGSADAEERLDEEAER